MHPVFGPTGADSPEAANIFLAASTSVVLGFRLKRNAIVLFTLVIQSRWSLYRLCQEK
jgi:hypothetical protein